VAADSRISLYQKAGSQFSYYKMDEVYAWDQQDIHPDVSGSAHHYYSEIICIQKAIKAGARYGF
jgi:hypothetical protein